MSIKERLQADLKDAMRSKDIVKRETIRSVTSAITNFEKANPGVELNLPKVLKQLESQRVQTIEAVKAVAQCDSTQDKTELLNTANYELEIIKGLMDEFLPKQLGDDETREAAKEIIASLGATKQDMGKVMGAFKTKYGASVDMKKVQTMVRELLP